MEFDKSKILTVLTGSKELEGKAGWLGDTPTELMEKVKKQDPEHLLRFDETCAYPFEGEDWNHTLFYPAPEPTYAERQAEWMKDNGLEIGNKVKITRKAHDEEEGWGTFWANDMDEFVGKTGVVEDISSEHGICIVVDVIGWWYPYFVLEPVKETYRPFKNAEEFKPYREKWLKMRDTVFQIDGYRNDGIIVDDDHFSWERAFRSYKFDDGTPFGIKEEV